MNFLSFLKKIGFSIQQEEDWLESFLPTNIFLKTYKSNLKNVRIGCSFSPEYLEDITQNYTPKLGLEALRFIIHDLKIKEIRLGIRWNKVEMGEGKIDFSYYKPYFDYCFEQNVSICLNIGPIKTFRWPEQHVPDWGLNKLKTIPKKGEILTEKNELSTYAIRYIDNLLKYLVALYSPKQIAKITSIQPENESFNKFGIYNWRMGESYILTLVGIIQKYFPNAGIMLNSSETKNLDTIIAIFRHLRNDVGFEGRLISGFNYYYIVPNMKKIPLLGRLDSISRTQISRKNLCTKNIMCARNFNYEIEVSEAQMEPWLPITEPGNSAQEFRYLIIRCVNRILDTNGYSVIRVWGIERLFKVFNTKNANREHKEIMEIIKSINT